MLEWKEGKTTKIQLNWLMFYVKWSDESSNLWFILQTIKYNEYVERCQYDGDSSSLHCCGDGARSSGTSERIFLCSFFSIKFHKFHRCIFPNIHWRLKYTHTYLSLLDFYVENHARTIFNFFRLQYVEHFNSLEI